MTRTRKNFTAAEKMVLLRRHLIDKIPVSTVCDEAKLQPTVFHRWLKQLVENGAAALERANGAPERPDLEAQRRIAHLEDRVRTKDADTPVHAEPRKSAGTTKSKETIMRSLCMTASGCLPLSLPNSFKNATRDRQMLDGLRRLTARAKSSRAGKKKVRYFSSRDASNA